MLRATTSNYIYWSGLVLCGVSLLVWVATRDLSLPVRAVYEGAGSGLLVLASTDRPIVDTSAAFTTAQGGVVHLHVTGAMRRDGELMYYRSVDGIIDPNEVYPARSLVGGVVFTIPLLGAFARLLEHPVGMMACVGSPLVMVVTNIFQHLLYRVRSSRISFSKQVGQTFTV